MAKHANNRCYACGKPATTKEHAPPLCFFPSGYRRDLITVPSCKQHNNQYSKDVEYVRDVLVSLAELGPESKGVFENALRSYDRRPAILSQVYQEFRIATIEGEERGVFKFDLSRTDRVMTAIAQALYFNDFGKKYRKWRVLVVNAQSDESLLTGQDPLEPLRKQLATIKFQYIETAQPKVFVYGRAILRPNAVVYQFIFYDAVIVNAIMKIGHAV